MSEHVMQCLSAAQAEQLVRRPLADQEAEELACHLEQCPSCALKVDKLLRGDTMAVALRQSADPVGATPLPPARELIAHLKKLVGSKPASEPIVFACAGCGQKLKVKAELAGKKAACPRCGQHSTVPAAAAPAPALDSHADKTLPSNTVAPISVSAAIDQTAQFVPGRSPTPSESASEVPWDFLAPAQQPDEVGRLGPYRVLQVLGHGGMGVVFRAEDPQLQRPVALKAMLPALAASPGAKQRFLREARAAAAIKHDHIVGIYQVGEDRGAPFLAMELLDGEPLDKRLEREGKLSPAEVLRIGREMAEGLAAAHERGLIHRDIKPANVWLEGKRGRVKILDFGLARSTADQNNLTQAGAILGTPSYMAPEQAQGEAVDGRSDLFSLGTMLYQLATGKLPFQGSTPMAVMYAVLNKTPPPVQELNPGLPLGLVELIGKLMARDPAERPASAQVVIEAIQAIEGGSVPAHATTAVMPSGESAARLSEQVGQGKPVPPRRRRRWLAAAVLLAVLGPLAYFFGPAVFRFATNQGELVVLIDDPDVEVLVKQNDVMVRQKTTQREFTLTVAAGDIEVFEKDGVKLLTKKFELTRGGKTTVSVTLDVAQVRQKPPGGGVKLPPGASPFDALRREAIPEYELKMIGDRKPAQVARELVAILGESRLTHPGALLAVAYRPDAKHLATGGMDSAVRIWDAATGRLENAFSQYPSWAFSLAYSPDGKQLAVGGGYKSLMVYDPNTGNARLTLKGHTHIVSSVVYSPDGKRLASTCSGAPPTGPGEVKVWDAATGQELVNIPTDPQVIAVAFSPDGKRLVGGQMKGGVKVWDTATGKEERALSGMKGYVRCVAFHPDGKWVAACEQNGDLAVKVWEVETGQVVQTHGLGSNVLSLAYSPDGSYLAAGASAGLVLVWEAATGREVRRLTGQTDIVGLSFSSDSKLLAAAQYGGRVRVWELTTGKETLPVGGHGGPVNCVAVSPDGQWLASGGDDGIVQIWDAATARPRAALAHRGYITRVALSSDGKRLASDNGDQTVKVWDSSTGKALFTAQRDTTHSQFNGLAFSPDGQRLVGVDRHGRFTVWEGTTGKILVDIPEKEKGVVGYCLAYSSDGKHVATGIGSAAQVWDTTTWKETHTLPHRSAVVRVVFSPDGKNLLTSTGINEPPKMWDVATGQEARVLEPTKMTAPLPVYSPEGRTILGVSSSKIMFWDAATGKLQQVIEQDIPGGLRDLAIAPDGRHLITANGNGTLFVLRLAPPAVEK